MMEEQALKTVADLLGARAVIDHITGTAPSTQVQVACTLAINNGGTLTTQDVATVNALAQP